MTGPQMTANNQHKIESKNMKTKTNYVSRARLLPAAAALLTFILAATSNSFAGSATWLANPASVDFNAANNWTTGGPPNGAADTATFATSNRRSLLLSTATELNSIVFNPGASAFTITNLTPTLTISGVGITNNSGILQNFKPGPAVINFENSATAGSNVLFTNAGSILFGASSTAGSASFINNGAIKFFNSTNAGNATFTNNAEILILDGSTAGTATFNNTSNGGIMIFELTESGDPATGAPTAGDAIITNAGGGVSGAGSGFLIFNEGASAGNALITNNGAVKDAFSAETIMRGDAANASLIANGGTGGGPGGLILFSEGATGGTARLEVFGNGDIDLSGRNAPGLTTGSIEGSGLLFLGARNLTVGTNNLSTTFSGMIQNGGNSGGTGGTLTKIGTGTLTLSGANTYTGGTTVTAGMLLASNTTGSATGTGAVKVNAGTLGGGGIIAGPVTIGTGTGSGATLAPAGGTSKQATLTSQTRFRVER